MSSPVLNELYTIDSHLVDLKNYVFWMLMIEIAITLALVIFIFKSQQQITELANTITNAVDTVRLQLVEIQTAIKTLHQIWNVSTGSATSVLSSAANVASSIRSRFSSPSSFP